nr:hypothetical protein [Tanacetum cinerariifolium]
MNSKKNIVDLETFRDMLHISPRVSGQSFDELPLKEEILDFLRFLGHSAQIKTLTDTSGTPRLIKSIMLVPLEKQHLSQRQESHISQLGGSSTYEGTDDEDVDAQDKDRNDDEGDKKDESDDGKEDDNDDKDGAERDDDDEEEITKIDEPKDTESGRDSEDDGNGEKDQGLRVSEEQRLIEEEKADELYQDVDINQGRGLQLSKDIKDSHVTLTPVNPDGMESIFATASSPIAPLQTPTTIMTPSTIATITTISRAPIPPTPIPNQLRDSYQRENDEFLQTIDDNMKRIIKEQVKIQVKEQVLRILPRIGESVNAQLEAEVLTRSSHSSQTSYAVADDLSKMELKKILIEKMEGNKSACRSTTESKSRQASVSEFAFVEEPVQTISQIDEPSHLVFETGTEDQPIVQTSQHPEWFPLPKKPPTPYR